MPPARLMLQFKLMQRLGHSVPLAGEPVAITAHVCKKFKFARPTKDALARYDGSASHWRHRQNGLQGLHPALISANGPDLFEVEE